MSGGGLNKSFGRFQCVRRLGEGAMGIVYEGIDVERGESVAIKTLAHRDPETITAIKREFRAVQDIHHPNLAELHELVVCDDEIYIAMEFVAGIDLTSYVRGRRSRPPVDDGGENGGRPPRGFDEPKLRSAFRQLVLALGAIHRADKVHRDVKPSNVLVTREGRVVLLDFGLVENVSAASSAVGYVVGTPLYMAPEQVDGVGVGPASDLYAVGVMLYEALTGRRPFDGSPDDVLLEKISREPPPPRTLDERLPDDLDKLATSLLRLDPADRADITTVLRVLSAESETTPSDAVAPPPLVGREKELGELAGAFDDVRLGATVLLAIEGESGVGKSALVRAFLSQAKAEHPQTLILSGRCYEREAVPYKALDEFMDGLATHLEQDGENRDRELLPEGTDALALLFPAMARLREPGAHASIYERDVHARQRVAFRALRELLRRLGTSRPLIVSIDDFHWTDADSLTLLASLLRGGEDAPRMLLVVTTRPAVNTAPPSLPTFLAAARRIEVGRLEEADATLLVARQLSHRADLSEEDARAIVVESGGHPLFIGELLRASRKDHGRGDGRTTLTRLDDVLFQRSCALAPEDQTVLFVVCLIGVPIAQELVANAAGGARADFGHAVDRLRGARLVRTRGPRLADGIEPFHDRVREAVSARLPSEKKAALHHAIAKALEAEQTVDPELLAEQWAGAGEPAPAYEYTKVAAARASKALAFKRAARLYAQALTLVGPHTADARIVREQLAEALANAGDSFEAATAFQATAEGASPGDAASLRGRAADQLVRSGRVREGLLLARSVLAAVGLAVPRSMIGCVLAFLFYRFALLVRGFGVTPRSAFDVDKKALLRIDTCWSVSLTLPYADPLRAGVCHARHILLALEAGEPERLACALAIEGAYLAAAGRQNRTRAEKMLVLAREAAARAASPYAEAIVFTNEGIVRCMQLRFGAACDILNESIVRLRQSRPGSAFEVSISHFFLFMAMSHAGRYKELRPRVENALIDAQARGDLFASTVLSVGAINNVWLVTGDERRARREVATAMTSWPNDDFHAVHYQILIAEGYIGLYDGEFERAYDRIHASLPALRRSMLLQMDGYRLEWATLRARVASAFASISLGGRRAKLLRESEQQLRVLERHHRDAPAIYFDAQRANFAAVQNDSAQAQVHLQNVVSEKSDEAWLVRESARVVLGRLRGDKTEEARGKAAIEQHGGVPSESLLRLQFAAFVGR